MLFYGSKYFRTSGKEGAKKDRQANAVKVRFAGSVMSDKNKRNFSCVLTALCLLFASPCSSPRCRRLNSHKAFKLCLALSATKTFT